MEAVTTLPSTFSAWQIKQNPKQAHHLSTDALDNLELATLSLPELQPGHALIRLHAVALNSRDLYTVSQSPLYPCPLEAGTSPCSDGAGTVVAVGAGSAFKTGSRVLLQPSSWIKGVDVADFHLESVLGGGNVPGTLREYRVMKDDWLIPCPRNLSFEEAATLPTAAATAVNAIFYGPAKITPGQTVLTQGTGGVSIAAIQVAAAIGCTVIATSTSQEKLNLVQSHGGKHTINYKTHPDWSKEVLRITEGKGVDLVVDVGGSSTILQSLASTRTGGSIAICGILGPGDEAGVAPAIMYGAKRVRGILGVSKEICEKTVRLFEEHDIHPVIGKVWDFKDAKKAFEMLMTQSVVGKIVIKVAQD